MVCPVCVGTARSISGEGRCEVCKGRGELPDDPRLTEVCRICVGRGHREGQICDVCHGYGRLPPLTDAPDLDSPFVFFVEAGKARTAHLKLDELFTSLSGEVRICDPYYGTSSLYRLDLLKHCRPIKFLTKRADRREVHVLPGALRDWKNEHGDVEFREHPGTELHDRYILAQDEFIIVGHGLKDIGSKDCFIIRIPRSLAPDLVRSMQDLFDRRWESSSRIV